MRDAPVNGPEAAARIHAASAELYRPGDRVALVLSSMLLTMQARRLVLRCHRLFGDMAEAEAWLASPTGGDASD